MPSLPTTIEPVTPGVLFNSLSTWCIFLLRVDRGRLTVFLQDMPADHVNRLVDSNVQKLVTLSLGHDHQRQLLYLSDYDTRIPERDVDFFGTIVSAFPQNMRIAFLKHERDRSPVF